MKARPEAPKGVARMFPVAIDYGRFSKPEQELGNSAQRQDSLADRWSQRTGIPIDLRLTDEGLTGWSPEFEKRRREDDAFGLARILKAIETGRIQAGDYLLLENLDRLSREKEVPATHLLTSILMAGVVVVQLAPEELELTRKSDMFTIFRAVMELSRGHGESQRKHQVCAASYASNREACARCRCGHERHGGPCSVGGCACRKFAAQESYQGRLPAWLLREGRGKGARLRRIVLIPERVKVVKDIFEWSAQGMGYSAIVNRLVKDGVPPFFGWAPRVGKDGKQLITRTGRPRWRKAALEGGGGRWTREYVAFILRDRAAAGEMRSKTGEIIPIPAAVTEDEWAAARADRADRNRRRGRTNVSGPLNIFQGLLKDALSGAPYYAITRTDRGRWSRIITQARGGDVEAVCFPEAAFEAAILAWLHEVDPAEVTSHGGPDPVAVLSGRIEALRGKVARQAAEIEASDEPAPKSVLKMLSRWEAEAEKLEEERRQAQQDASSPLSETWGQAKGLLGMVQTAEQRLRLRSVLRRIVEEIRLLIVPRGWDRVAAVQMRFAGSDAVRSYFMAFRRGVMPDGKKASRRKRERGEDIVCVRSLRRHDEIDLRDPAHVQALRKHLLDLDLARFQEEATVLRG